MKIISKLSFLLLLLLAFAAEAQTETVTPRPKKLQQLYLSIGTGPAVTNAKNAHNSGGRHLVNFTYSSTGGTLFRLNLQNTQFVHSKDTKPKMFNYLGAYSYHTSFVPSKKHSSIDLLIGKSKKLNNLLQVQAFGGIGFNERVETYWYENDRIYDFAKITYLPGVVLQAEAMLLPTRFAGLTLGGYYHYVPEISNGGVTLSLNLGLLK